MSRLYDALKEVSRGRESNRDGEKAGLWEAWGIQGIDIPPAQPAPEILAPRIAETNGTTNLVAEALAEAVETAAPEIEMPAAVEVPQGETLGALTPVAVDKRARIIPHATDAAVIEHYRRLRTKILQIREEQPFNTLLVTSANPQEGKTVTVLNLALSLAMLPSFKVLVVDGDLRKGSLGNWLGVSSDQPGLSNLVDGSARLEEVVLKSESIPMHFMVRGNSRVTDAHASQFDVHFRRLAESFDLVILDSPPVNLLADVQLLASCSQAVLFVVRSFVTSRQAMEKAVQELSSFRVIGTVLNASSVQRRRSHYGYYY